MIDSAAAAPSGWGWVAMTMSVLLFAGLSVGAYLLLVRGGRPAGRSARPSSAQRRLADQFARGQIDEQEYRHLAAALEEGTPGTSRKPRRRPGPLRR
jgi:putative membrane protein